MPGTKTTQHKKKENIQTYTFDLTLNLAISVLQEAVRLATIYD
jgi:hypothetical protein